MRVAGLSASGVKQIIGAYSAMVSLTIIRERNNEVAFLVVPTGRYRWRRSTMSRGRGHFTRHLCSHGLIEVGRWLLDARAFEVRIGRHRIRNMDELFGCRLWHREVENDGHAYRFSSLCCCEYGEPRGDLTGYSGEE